MDADRHEACLLHFCATFICFVYKRLVREEASQFRENAAWMKGDQSNENANNDCGGIAGKRSQLYRAG
ncbi:MAG: hypothetical protein DCC55_24090 [Chloroflexi bacterium]|nr:MAG: hypothetical protein DCC55_24090 [Chloroflexota bacterium]